MKWLFLSGNFGAWPLPRVWGCADSGVHRANPGILQRRLSQWVWGRKSWRPPVGSRDIDPVGGLGPHRLKQNVIF